MKEIIAIVRRDRAAATKAELAQIGCSGYTAFAVLGRGRQSGLRGELPSFEVPFLPKIYFDIFVEDERKDETMEAIRRAAHTGRHGDGRIFVLEAGEVHRISEQTS